MELMGMVANHRASLPHSPLLPAYAPPQAQYDGQEVPPPPGVPHRHQHDHPHWQVTDPSTALEVFVLDNDYMYLASVPKAG
jgi:hypothetical protein